MKNNGLALATIAVALASYHLNAEVMNAISAKCNVTLSDVQLLADEMETAKAAAFADMQNLN
jgi:hypothetical protein